jgi:small conductance mechanosensitive channel
MALAFDRLRNSDHGDFIIGDLEWFGVQSLGDSAVVLRARIKCAPGKQWAIGRAYNEICKGVMDECGIEIPYPHQTIYFGENKDGSAPALHLKDAREAR